MALSFLTVDAFRPDAEPWVPVGPIASVVQESGSFLLRLADQPLAIQLSVLSPTCLRVRFSPRGAWDYRTETSLAVINRELGPVEARVLARTSERLIVDTGAMRIEADLLPYALRVYRGAQLICADQPGRNLVYRPGRAWHRQHQANARKRRLLRLRREGWGAAAEERQHHDQLQLRQLHLRPRADPNRHRGWAAQPGGAAVRLDPAADRDQSLRPLATMPGRPIATGCSWTTFRSHSSTSATIRIPIAAVDTSSARLFGELDYYVFLGDGVPDILRQFTSLTGRSSMPPKYAFGFHQGCYGYYDRARLESVARDLPRGPHPASMVCTSTSTSRTIIASSPIARSSFRAPPR